MHLGLFWRLSGSANHPSRRAAWHLAALTMPLRVLEAWWTPEVTLPIRMVDRWTGRSSCSLWITGTFWRPCASGHRDRYLLCLWIRSILGSWWMLRLGFHFEVWHHQVTIQCRQIDDGMQTPCLLRHQKQPAEEPERCFIRDPLYDSLGQQGIHGLLEILAAIPGAESDAVMGQLRSLLEIETHPFLGCVGGPAGGGQSLPGEPPPVSCQRRPAAGAWAAPEVLRWSDTLGGSGPPCRRWHERTTCPEW